MEKLGRNFASDNVAPIAPEILAALAAANEGAAPAYGADSHTERLTRVACDFFEAEVAIFPVATGTAANALALSTLVPPYGAVYCHQDAHIMDSECGAPELLTGGAKLVGLASANGKIAPSLLAGPVARALGHGVHQSLPAAVSISQSTEWGTIYQPGEIGALAAFAKGRGMSLHMDGARFANAVASLGCTPAEMTWKQGVSALSLGATKNGALAAEAVVFFDPKQAEGFEFRRKRAGHLWSKMRFLSAQLVAYLENGLWLRNASRANWLATRLAEGLIRLPGVSLVHPVEANEIFVVLPEAMIARLQAEGFAIRRWFAPEGVAGTVVRLVLSFAAAEDEVEQFLVTAAG